MFHFLKCLWADENGFIISAELVLVGTIVGLAMVTGLAEVSSAVNSELHDVAQGFSACNAGDGDDWNEDSGFYESGPEHEQYGGDLYGNN